jgi:hypothetical protein
MKTLFTATFLLLSATAAFAGDAPKGAQAGSYYWQNGRPCTNCAPTMFTTSGGRVIIAYRPMQQPQEAK